MRIAFLGNLEPGTICRTTSGYYPYRLRIRLPPIVNSGEWKDSDLNGHDGNVRQGYITVSCDVWASDGSGNWGWNYKHDFGGETIVVLEKELP